jgi:hypothetical protein
MSRPAALPLRMTYLLMSLSKSFTRGSLLFFFRQIYLYPRSASRKWVITS